MDSIQRALLLAFCALVLSPFGARAQALVRIDPSQIWVGYMNVSALPANGGGYQFGNAWATAALQAAFVGNQAILQPCTNVWETTDTYWVQADGVTPNEIMDANFYVQDDTLLNTNVIFIGQCVSNSLTAAPEPLTGISYTTIAFIKMFDGNYGLTGEVTNNLVAGQAFSITLNTTGAAHVQYGFETTGPDANPTTEASLGEVVLAVAPPQAEVTVDPNQTWLGYMNIFNLPAAGGGYQFGSPWGASALQADFVNGNQLFLEPDTNVWETTDTYWVQADGMTPNKIMDASFYVQSTNLSNTNLVFVGACETNTLTASPEPLTGVSYSCSAFIKTFNASFAQLGSSSVTNLVPGQAFFVNLITSNATYVQYGFETIGPDASPATASNLGDVIMGVTELAHALLAPTNNAPKPTPPASSVLAMYNSSGTYPDVPIQDWCATWSGALESPFTIPNATNVVLHYGGLQFAGVEFYAANSQQINASNYNTFHVDLWTPGANQFGIQLVSLDNGGTQAAQVNYFPSSGTVVTDRWVSLDIPLNQFTTANNQVDISALQQLLWIDNLGGGGVTGGIYYIDNVYFYSNTVPVSPTLTASLSGGSLNLSFPSEYGFNYVVQYEWRLV